MCNSEGWRPFNCNICIGFFLVLVFTPFQPIQGQEEREGRADRPPRILTSDLQNEQIVEESEMEVHFVIADSNSIQEVTIDGVPAEINPWPTILITRTFRFNPGLTEIVVTAMDDDGNKTIRRFLVAYQAELPDSGAGKESPAKKTEIVTTYQGSIRYEYDDNPITDLSVVVPIGELKNRVPDQGIVPDSQQSDQLLTLTGSLTLNRGRAFGSMGIIATDYKKSENMLLESKSAYFAGGYQFNDDGKTAIPASLIFTIINVGGIGYVISLSGNVGYLEYEQEASGELRSHLYNVELTYKDFNSEQQKDGFQIRGKWEFNNIGANQGETTRHRASLGNNNDGLPISNYWFAGWDSDIKRGWDESYLYVAGVGVQYRQYPNDNEPLVDNLGDTRLDLVIRFNIGVGWEFWPGWNLILNDDSIVNASNKRPYQRNKLGFILSAVF